MNAAHAIGPEADVKRVGKSGQISLGKQHAGQYFREERHPDGTIILVPVVVVPRSHWSIRDESKIQKALAWAAENPARESDLDALVTRASKAATRGKRGK